MQPAETLSVYEALLCVTAEMLEAARAHDWDRLVERERACRILVEQLRQISDDAPLDPDASRRKAEIIRRVLADDAEIRNITEPWMAQLSSLLHRQRRGQNVRAAYDGG